MANTADKIYDLIAKTVEAQGVKLWDVVFVKEGASHYLRVFIDKPEGVSIDDCTNVSHAIDPIIDEADPIDVSYYLEVSSPGLNRELKKEKHFLEFTGHSVNVKLYKAFENQKSFTANLIGYDDGPIFELPDGKQVRFSPSEISKVLLNEEI